FCRSAVAVLGPRSLSVTGAPVFSGYGAHRYLHSFPTRRSSDLQHEDDGTDDPRAAGVREHVETRAADLLEPPDPRHRMLGDAPEDRKSTRLNSSHVKISYAVFCLKKKNQYGSPLRPLTRRRHHC